MVESSTRFVLRKPTCIYATTYRGPTSLEVVGTFGLVVKKVMKFRKCVGKSGTVRNGSSWVEESRLYVN